MNPSQTEACQHEALTFQLHFGNERMFRGGKNLGVSDEGKEAFITNAIMQCQIWLNTVCHFLYTYVLFSLN